MFIVDIEYTANLDQIDKVLAEHRAWLDKYYQIGVFLFSGPKNPRTGGIVVAKAGSKQELEQIMADDPFARNNVAKHTVHEFQALKAHPQLTQFIDL